MLQEFDSLVRQRKKLKEWWELGKTIASYNKKFYCLHVDLQRPALITYCGQEYAGAQNYHDAPSFFYDAVQQEIAEQSHRILGQAYQKELDRLNTAIEKHRALVLEQLNGDD